MSTDLVEAIRDSPRLERLWSAWYAATYPRVFYAAHRFARGNVEMARELAQDSFARFVQYGAIERVTNEKHALAFLIQTCRNLAIDRDGRAREVSLQDIPEYELVPIGEIPSGAALDLEEMLQVLRPEERQVIQWIRDGFSIADVARKLGISYTAAGVRLHRIRKRLQKEIGM